MTTRFFLKFSLLTLHLGSATLWLGAMTYSLFVLQPRLGKLLKDPEKIESVHRVLAVGNRWPVMGLIESLERRVLPCCLLKAFHSSRCSGLSFSQKRCS